jgi:hypothetical protein
MHAFSGFRKTKKIPFYRRELRFHATAAATNSAPMPMTIQTHDCPLFS